MTKNLSDIPANLAGGAAVTIDPMTTRGDLIVRDATNVTDRLPVGTNGQILKSDGVDVSWDDADSGSGKNYILNPSAAADDTTGVAADAGFSVTRTTTASELPEESVGSAFKISGTGLAPGDKVAFAILASGIDDADGGRFGRAKVSIKDISGTINGEYSIQVYDVTNSVYVGDSDTITGTGTYYLDVPFIAAGDYEFHLLTQTAAPTNIGLSTITIEPASQTVAGVVGKWQAYTPTTYQGFGAITSGLQWRISGQNVEIMGDITPGGVSATEGQIELPNSYTINFFSTSDVKIVGSMIRNTSSSSTQRYLVLGTHGDSYLNFSRMINGVSGNNYTPVNGDDVASTGVKNTFTASVPVAELANAHTPTATDVQYENARGRWYRNAAYSYDFNNTFDFDTEDTATFAPAVGISNASGVFTVSAAGTYTITTTLAASTSWAANTVMQLKVDRGSGLTIERTAGRVDSGGASFFIGGTCNTTLAAGDSFAIIANSTETIIAGTTNTCIEITRVSDYSARKASLPFPNGTVRLDTANGHGSTNTAIRRFTNITSQEGDAFTYVDSSTDGMSITANRDMVVGISYVDRHNSTTCVLGITLNAGGSGDANGTGASALASEIFTATVTPAMRLAEGSSASGQYAQVSVQIKLSKGDVIRAHDQKTNNVTLAPSSFSIQELYRLG